MSLHLKGLENLKVTNGKATLEAALSSSADKQPVRLWLDDKEDSPLNVKSPFWMTVRMFGYVEARKAIYLPAYTWVLENRLAALVAELAATAAKQSVVLLDYETNSNIEDTRKPLSHASLIAAAIRERR